MSKGLKTSSEYRVRNGQWEWQYVIERFLIKDYGIKLWVKVDLDIMALSKRKTKRKGYKHYIKISCETLKEKAARRRRSHKILTVEVNSKITIKY